MNDELMIKPCNLFHTPADMHELRIIWTTLPAAKQ